MCCSTGGVDLLYPLPKVLKVGVPYVLVDSELEKYGIDLETKRSSRCIYRNSAFEITPVQGVVRISIESPVYPSLSQRVKGLFSCLSSKPIPMEQLRYSMSDGWKVTRIQ